MKSLFPHLLTARLVAAAILVFLTSALSAEEAPAAEKQKRADDLMARSVILMDHKHWTLIPKGAVVHIPDFHKQKVTSKPKGKFLTFKEFLTINSTWVHSMPISLEYARGKERFEESHFSYLKGMNKVVVTTYKRGPITLHKNAYPLPQATAKLPSN